MIPITRYICLPQGTDPHEAKAQVLEQLSWDEHYDGELRIERCERMMDDDSRMTPTERKVWRGASAAGYTVWKIAGRGHVAKEPPTMADVVWRIFCILFCVWLLIAVLLASFGSH